MNLKKSDKLIAIIGVIILVAAGIGIAVYTYEEPDEVKDNGDDDKKIFEISYEEENGSKSPEIYTFRKGIIMLKKSIIDEMVLPVPDMDNIKSITLNISYEDNKIGGLLGVIFKNRLGNDQITVTIVNPDEKSEKVTLKGSGNKEVSYSVNSMIDTSDIEAESVMQAESILESRYKSEWKGGEFKISATHKTAVVEKLRPLLRLRERLDQDSFTVEMTYEYYVYDLNEPEEPEEPEDGDNKETDWNRQTSISNGRDWI